MHRSRFCYWTSVDDVAFIAVLNRGLLWTSSSYYYYSISPEGVAGYFFLVYSGFVKKSRKKCHIFLQTYSSFLRLWDFRYCIVWHLRCSSEDGADYPSGLICNFEIELKIVCDISYIPTVYTCCCVTGQHVSSGFGTLPSSIDPAGQVLVSLVTLDLLQKGEEKYVILYRLTAHSLVGAFYVEPYRVAQRFGRAILRRSSGIC